MNLSAGGVMLVLKIAFLAFLLELFILCFVSIQTILLTMLIWSICPGLLSAIYLHFDVFETLVDFADVVDTRKGQNPQHMVYRKPEYLKEWQVSASPVEVSGTGPEDTPDKYERVNMSAPLEDSRETWPVLWKEAVPEFGSPMTQDVVEKEPPSIASTARRTGLRPLTLTLTNLPSREVRSGSGSKRTMSMSNGFKRHSSVFYVSEPRHVPRPVPVGVPTETAVLGESLPVPAANLLGNVDELATMLEQERNQTTRLRGELKELRDQSRAREHHLMESQQQVRDLGAAVEARDVTIRELCVGLESLQQDNAVLKEAAWRVECLKVANETRAAERSDAQMLLRRLCMMVSGYRWFFARLQAQDWTGTRSLVKDHRDRVNGVGVDRTETVLEETTQRPLATHNRHIGRGRVPQDLEMARASSLDSIFKPPTSPTVRPSGSLDPSSRADQYSDLEEAKLEYDLEEAIEFEFPTISPEFHPSYAHASARSQAVAPSRCTGTVIYEVDGCALVKARKDSECSSPESAAQHQSIASEMDGYYGQRDRLDQTTPSLFPDYHFQGDSDFYGVPASAFVLPYPGGQGF